MYKKTANKFIRGENIENKTAQQKSRCVVCDSKNWTFLKKKKKIFFESFKSLYIIKRMLSYCYYCQNYSKDINSGIIMTKNRLMLNKIKCCDFNFKNLIRYKKNDNTKFKL